MIQLKNRDLEPEGMSIPDACLYSGFSRSRLYLLLESREVDSIIVGKRRFVLRSSLLDYMMSRPRISRTCNAAARPR